MRGPGLLRGLCGVARPRRSLGRELLRVRTTQLGASDLGLTPQAAVGLVSRLVEHPLNARLGPVYISWVHENPQGSPRMDV